MEQNIESWIGRSETREDVIRSEPARFMQMTLDRPADLSDGDALPPLWHWLYFLETKPLSELGRDGHPQKGGFLPPVSLPRRMWAGGRFEFHAPVPLGQKASKRSTIKNIVEKDGRSGRLCFVTVLHEVVLADGTLAITEEHDIVYREDPSDTAPKPAPPQAPTGADVSEEVTPSQVMLFRYSALTFNGHRIHYDPDYARNVEGYEGLVFHGPLTATLLVDLAAGMVGTQPRAFEFRGLSPLAGMQPFALEALREDNSVELWARRHDGVKAMQARASF